MTKQIERAKAFAALHIKGDPLILFNIWDAGSAQAIASVGAKALATGSWSVAAAHGFGDSEALPFDLVIANLKRIVAVVGDDLPVTLDMEGGYGEGAEALQANVKQVIEAGAVGINFEDQIVGGEGLYDIQTQCSRIAAIRGAADQAGIPFFINARTDIFLKLYPAEPDESHLDDAIERAKTYAEAGASGFFAPGLRDADDIRKLCSASPLPVNIMMWAGLPPLSEMAALGLARISYGGGPYRQAMEALKTAGREVFAAVQSSD